MHATLRILALVGLSLTLVALAAGCDDDEKDGETTTPTAQSREIVINLTTGTDDPHRASLALAMAGSALQTDHDVVIFLNVDGVYLAVRDLPDDIQYSQFPPVREMLADVIESGAVVLVCPICINEEGITSDQLIDEVMLATPNELFPYFDGGAAVLSY